MYNTELIRNAIMSGLKKEPGFEEMAAIEVNGFNFAAVDIALPGKNGICETFRIAVVQHGLRATT